MRRSFSIYQKLISMLVVLVLVPLVASTFFGLREARRILVEQVGESRSYALVLAAERLEAFANRLVSAAFFTMQSRQLQEWIREIDEQNARADLSQADRLDRQRIFSGIDSFLENLSVNLIGAESYVTILTPGGAQFTNYDFISSEPRRYLEAAGNELSASRAPRIVWRGIEPNYVFPGLPGAEEVVTLAMTLGPANRSERDGLIIMSIPSNVVRQVGRIPGPPGVIVLVDHEHDDLIALSEPDLGVSNELIAGVPANELDGLTQVGDQSYYFAQRPVLGDALSLVYAFDEQTVAVALRGIRVRQTIVALLISVVAIATGFLFSRHLAVPLRQLTAYATGFEPTIPPVLLEKRNDEIGTLQLAFVELHTRVQRLLDEQKENQEQKRKAELEALQAQIQPHFLFNTLNTIRWAAANGNTQKVTSTIIALASLLKITITSEDALIPLSQEFEVLERYADIMQLRHGTALQCVFSADPVAHEIRVPRLVLQPLLENAILHGFSPGDEGLISVRATVTDGSLTIAIVDNGRGLPDGAEERPTQGARRFSHVGIANVRERLELHYGDAASLCIAREPAGGTRAVVTIDGAARFAAEHATEEA